PHEPALLDHLVRPPEEQRRNRQAECLILLRTVSCPEDKQEEEEEKTRPHIVAGGLLTRGPPSAEPSEAHAKSVPGGKRTVPKVPEESDPQRVARSTRDGCGGCKRSFPPGGRVKGDPAVPAPGPRVRDATERRTSAL